MLVQEQVGPGHQRAGLGGGHPAVLAAGGGHARTRWRGSCSPAIRGEREECYAITEEGAGSDVDAIVATARRDGDDYVLNGEKWHVTSYNCADYAFFQGKLVGGEHDGEHAMFLVDLPSPGVRVVRTPAYTHTISHHHPIVAFDRRAGAGHAPGRRGGRRHELRLRVVPVRADDGGRALPGRGASGWSRR